MNKFADFVFKLPIEILAEEQLSIVNLTKEKGFYSAMFMNSEKRYIWKSILLRHLDYDKIGKEIKARYVTENRSIDFSLRNDMDLDWVWNPEIDKSIYQNLFERLQPYIYKLGRVQVLLQVPGLAIPLHTDLMPGQQYENFIYSTTSPQDVKVNNVHSKNQFLTIKVPLTEKFLNNGHPVANCDDKTARYDVGNNVFAIDEYNIKHGAMACGHWRGVIAIDGIFNVEKLKQDKIPILLEPVSRTNFFKRIMTVHRQPDTLFIGYDDGRQDIKSMVGEYGLMRLRSPSFLGAAYFFSEDRLSFAKHEFWISEEAYAKFVADNRKFISAMVAMYETVASERGIKTSRVSKTESVHDLNELEIVAITNRIFIGNITLEEKFYKKALTRVTI